MVKSLGDYNKEQSSSADVNNIKWTKKNPPNEEKPRKERKEKISPTNIIPSKNKKVKDTTEKVFKIEEESKKSHKNITGKKFQKSSVANCKIKPGFRRPGR